MRIAKGSAVVLSVIALGGCMSAAQHQADLNAPERVTVGVVQKEIRIGMSGADVASALGTPNIVTTDDKRNEVWIYDKVATQASYSRSEVGVMSLILGGVSSVGGLLGGSASQSTGASSTTQRTLTIVIKFDADKKVKDFSYHASQF